MQFELRGGAYWYVGNYEPSYYSERPRFVVINDAYAPVVYTRPVVDVRVAPPAFHGEIVAVAPGVGMHAVVGAPVVSAGVYVAAPPPPVVQVGVGVGIGGPVVAGPAPVYVDRHHDNGRHNGWYKNGRGAPPPQQGWRGAPPQQAGWRGSPPASGFRGSPGGPPPPPHGGGFRGAPAPAPAAGFRGSPPPAAHAQPGHPSKGWRR
jgi:hypothetical protein